MNRSLLTLAAVAAATLAVSAQAQSIAIGGSSMPRPAPHADPLGPRFGSGTVAESVARAEIEKDGYTGVRSLMRTTDHGWQAVALTHENKPVVVSLDAQGKVTEIR
jgi:hypothetical protein